MITWPHKIPLKVVKRPKAVTWVVGWAHEHRTPAPTTKTNSPYLVPHDANLVLIRSRKRRRLTEDLVSLFVGRWKEPTWGRGLANLPQQPAREPQLGRIDQGCIRLCYRRPIHQHPAARRSGSCGGGMAFVHHTMLTAENLRGLPSKQLHTIEPHFSHVRERPPGPSMVGWGGWSVFIRFGPVI